MSKVFGGRYEVLEQIGSGGMAIVYKARDLLLNRIVTIKVLREQFLSDEDFIRRFRREAQAAASLSHPNIVSIYDVGKDGDIEYIVMEYIEGRNLKEIIRDYAPLSTEHAIYIARQIGEAIRHAHEHHIIHRDIKPQNILITEDGRAKVTDFGIARAVSSATVTHTGDIVGSVHYLSPEQAKGTQTNEQSDIYSLGIILYELLTGKVPYDGETPISIALKHLQERPVPPSKFNSRVGRDLETLIMRAIAKSSEDRYASAKELLDDLDLVKEGRPLNKSFEENKDDIEATLIHKSLAKEINSKEMSDKEIGSPKKRRKIWPWVVAAVFLLMFTGGGLWFRSYLMVGNATVPSVIGLSIPEAGRELENANLILSPDPGEEFSDTVEKSKIISQTPEANSTLKVGKEVKVIISKGPQTLKFPDLLNPSLSKENAENLIATYGFNGEITYETRPDAKVPAGNILDQDPAPGATWFRNGDIHLVVSGGPQLTTINMPNVIAKSAVEAQMILEKDYNLIVIVDSEDSTEYPRDVVMSTDPLPGEPIAQGEKVKIIVSRGPGPMAKQIDQETILANLLHVVPNDGKTHDVSIKFSDYRGWTEVWHNLYQVGVTSGLPNPIRYYPPALVQIVVDGAIQYENKFS